MPQQDPFAAVTPADNMRFHALYLSSTLLALSFGAVALAVAMGIPYLWFSRWPATPFLKALRNAGLASCSASMGLCLYGVHRLGGIPVEGAGLVVLGAVLTLSVLDSLVRHAYIRGKLVASKSGL